MMPKFTNRSMKEGAFAVLLALMPLGCSSEDPSEAVGVSKDGVEGYCFVEGGNAVPKAAPSFNEAAARGTKS